MKVELWGGCIGFPPGNQRLIRAAIPVEIAGKLTAVFDFSGWAPTYIDFAKNSDTGDRHPIERMLGIYDHDRLELGCEKWGEAGKI